MSSQLEGLFISLYHISCGGKPRGRSAFNTTEKKQWIAARMSQFGTFEMADEELIPARLRPLISALHQLFWPLPQGESHRKHNAQVTAAQVVQTCHQFLPAASYVPASLLTTIHSSGLQKQLTGFTCLRPQHTPHGSSAFSAALEDGAEVVVKFGLSTQEEVGMPSPPTLVVEGREVSSFKFYSSAR
jgi:hypothetical protein